MTCMKFHSPRAGQYATVKHFVFLENFSSKCVACNSQFFCELLWFWKETLIKRFINYSYKLLLTHVFTTFPTKPNVHLRTILQWFT